MSDTTGHVKERKVANLLCGFSEPLSQLGNELMQYAGISLAEFDKFLVSQFCDFTFCFSFDPRSSCAFAKHCHLTKEITFVEVSDNNFPTILIFDDDRDGTFCDVEDRIAYFAGKDNGASTRVASLVRRREKLVHIVERRVIGCKAYHKVVVSIT